MSDQHPDPASGRPPKTHRGQLVWFLVALAALTGILALATDEAELVWGLAAAALVVGYLVGVIKRRRPR
ncbi:hypothetical protein AACH06_25425 [Ideonella sp. DXS29W]|uniref:Uncharacterized protein n=1 Tax=Ideonella lacteola TaxID=2984193 RepID=A0ABU9BW32_9BURK